MPTPLLSIIIVCYNSESFIAQTISSCLRQDMNDYEIIISNDFSTDNTWTEILKFDDPKIKRFNQKNNIGEYANRNFCIEKSKGKFILFIDGEDILYPNVLNFLSQFLLQYPNAGQFIGLNWNELILLPKVLNPKDFFCADQLGIGITALNFTNLVLNRCALIETNKFDRNDIKIGDTYIQYKIALSYDTVLIPNGFSWWRRRKGQASEEILKNKFNYMLEVYKFFPSIIVVAKEFFLRNDEAKQIEINYFGNLLRFCVKQSIFFNSKCARFLWLNRIKLRPYFYTILHKPRRNYLSNYNGENPF